MVSIFYWILNMTIQGSILIVMLMGLRRIKKLPRTFIYAMYSLILLKLICPLGLTTGFSLLNLLPKGSVKLINLAGNESDNTELLFSNFIQDANTYQPFVIKSDGLTRCYEIGSVVWITVCGALLFGYFLVYLITMRELRKSITINGNIYQSQSVNVPMVVGIIKPRIILPETVKEEYLEHLIAHEKIHIKHRDNLWRLLAILICCIHWFNPFVWITLKYFFADIEFACDEKVILHYDSRRRAEYAAALLEFTNKEPVVYAASFGGGNVKIRIKRILDYKRLPIVASIIVTCLFAIIAIISLSNK
ncbi:M56 family metallopeptidase [Anaerosporobacter sp.]